MRIAPAKNGAAWLVRGFALFRRNPSVWLMLAFAYWLSVTLLAQLPYLGRALSMVLLPPVTMSFLALCAALEAGKPVHPGILAAAFRSRFRELAMLGVLNLACFIVVLAAVSLADGAVLEWALGGPGAARETVSEASAARTMLTATVAAMPVMLVFWFAPPLVGWGGMGALQSLFYSFFAVWRNWRAFAVYGAVLVLVGVVLLTVLGLVAALTRQNDAVSVVLLVLTVFLMPTGFASSYASYRDVFPEAGTRHPGDDAPAA
jgi:hypothetical protein